MNSRKNRDALGLITVKVTVISRPEKRLRRGSKRLKITKRQVLPRRLQKRA